MKLEIVLKPCPWCRKTPGISMPIEEETWCWYLYCGSKECLMRPKSPYVSIRNTTKTTFSLLIKKVEELAEKWNTNNPYSPYEKLEVDLRKIEKNFTNNPNGDIK